jgi:hypothetical protein
MHGLILLEYGLSGADPAAIRPGHTGHSQQSVRRTDVGGVGAEQLHKCVVCPTPPLASDEGMEERPADPRSSGTVESRVKEDDLC